ncbi:MAG: hypothetical protein HC927_08490 [Deltaproteobacteria bacterium]|nr:hypothetical protein [Deltaproteobacteria bacterium]
MLAYTLEKSLLCCNASKSSNRGQRVLVFVLIFGGGLMLLFAEMLLRRTVFQAVP